MISDYRITGIPPNYLKVLNAIKEKKGKLFWNVNQRPIESNFKEGAVAAIHEYLMKNGFTFQNWSVEDISERLYNDIFDRSVLTAPLKDVWVNRITINSWNVLTVQFTNGKSVQADGFLSPQHAEEVIRGLLQDAGINGDKSAVSCKVPGKLRITALFPPVVSDDTGVCCCIQKLSQRIFTEQDYTANDFAVKKELDFLLFTLRHGISVLIAGKRGTGKTSFFNYLLSILATGLNVVSIDQSDSELTTGTRLLASEKIPLTSLIDHAIGLEPDIIGCNLDRCIAQPASLNGYTVIATAEADDPLEGLHHAALGWCQSQGEYNYDTAFAATCRAFPLVVTIHTYPDHKPRIINISECYANGKGFELRALWNYLVKVPESVAQAVRGRHAQIDNISLKMTNHLLLFGAAQEEIDKYNLEE